jgi:hypothetical protein
VRNVTKIAYGRRTGASPIPANEATMRERPMLTQHVRQPAAPATRTVATLMIEEETTISDAPLYAPEDFGAGLLLLGLLLSPKPPKER